MTRVDRQRCRHRLDKLLFRRGLRYPGLAWTQAHRLWINGLTWSHPADRVVVDDYLLAFDHVETRLMELDAQLVAALRSRPPASPPDVIFVTALPPYRQIGGSGVTSIAIRALRPAGVTVPRPGAHLFRHWTKRSWWGSPHRPEGMK